MNFPYGKSPPRNVCGDFRHVRAPGAGQPQGVAPTFFIPSPLEGEG